MKKLTFMEASKVLEFLKENKSDLETLRVSEIAEIVAERTGVTAAVTTIAKLRLQVGYARKWNKREEKPKQVDEVRELHRRIIELELRLQNLTVSLVKRNVI